MAGTFLRIEIDDRELRAGRSGADSRRCANRSRSCTISLPAWPSTFRWRALDLVGCARRTGSLGGPGGDGSCAGRGGPRRVARSPERPEDLKNTGKGNLFVIFGELDIAILPAEDGQVQIRINGVDVFHPSTGEVRSDGPEGIACWFIDTDYNEESFFVRHAYFLGANDP